MAIFTFLVKSDKNKKICLACLDEKQKWVRPLKPGGFEETDIIMDNGNPVDIFDVVDMELGSPCPIKHHTENMKFNSNTEIKFVRRLNETEQRTLLRKLADPQLLEKVESKDELFDVLVASERSLHLIGPITSFDITERRHPRIYVTGKNDEEFYVTCTDINFCELIRNKSDEFKKSTTDRISSQDTIGLKDKKIYFVIGLTGDHLDENNKIQDGRFTSNADLYKPRYWPLVVSILVIPYFI